MGVLLGLALYEGAVLFCELHTRSVEYKKAMQHAAELGKPLLVVGGTKGRHGGGDLCIDLNPASCQGARRFMGADIRHIPLPDKWAGVVFAAHVLEHLPTVEDAQVALRELCRVGDVVYILAPSKLSISAWVHPGHHLWVRQNQGILEIQQR